MKKILSTITALALLCTALPAYAYSKTEYHNKADELKTLISECKSLGINTQYEEIDANIIETYADRIDEYSTNGVSSTITNYQLSELDAMYSTAKANLTAYKNGTKTAPQKVYQSGKGLVADGASLKAANGAPYFTLGYGHFGLTNYVGELKSYGYDNLQTLINLSDIIVGADRTIDNWETSISGGADVSFTVVDDNGYNNDTSLHIVNGTATADDKFGRLFQRIAVKPNSSYIISFYAKGSASSGACSFSVDGYSNQTMISGLTTDSWKKITLNFSTGDQEVLKDLTFLFTGKCNVYIDNINIHRSGNPRNVVKNGGFDGDGHADFDIVYNTNNNLTIMLQTLSEAEKNNTYVSVLLELQEKLPEVINNGVYDIDNALVAEVEKAYIEDVLATISDYSSLGSIILVNEPSYNTSEYSTTFQPKFEQYLQTVHGTITTLNAKYGKSYSSFASVNMPTEYEASARFYDWKNFNEGVFTAWYNKTVKIVKDVLPNIPVSVKAQNDFTKNDYNYSEDIRNLRMTTGVNMELLDASSDFHGNDTAAYYGEEGSLNNTLKWYDYLNSISNKPIYNSENHIIPDAQDATVTFNTNINKFTKDTIWQSAIHGLDMSSIWTWSLASNSESKFYGHIAMRPSVISDLAKANLDLNRLASKVTAIANKTPDVAILRSDASRIYNDRYENAVTIAYNAANEAGQKVGFVSEKNIASKLNSYKTLIIPMANNVEANVIDEISNFTGNVIIIGADSLTKDEYNKTYTGTYATKVTNIKNGATKFSVTNDKSHAYKISAPTVATVAASLIDETGVVVKNSDATQASDIEWQYATYQNGYIVNINNYDKVNAKTLSIKLNGQNPTKITSLLDNSDVNGNVTLAEMGSGIYYVRNAEDEIASDDWGDVDEGPQLVKSNEITSISATRNSNNNTITWKAQNYGKFNVYEVKNDGTLTFILSTYDDSFEDVSTGVKTYAVKCVTENGESYGKAITVGFDVSTVIIVDKTLNDGSAELTINYTNNQTHVIAANITVTAKNADNSFVGAVETEQIIPVGKSINYSKVFRTNGVGKLTEIIK